MWQSQTGAEVTALPAKACPDCGGVQVIRCGRRSGVQRLRCRACGRCFTEVTGTAVERLRLRSMWTRFLECFEEKLTVRDAARRLGMSTRTIMRWRHRLLAEMEREDRAVLLDGVVELAQFPVRDPYVHARLPERERAWLLLAWKRGGPMRCAIVDNTPGHGHQQALDSMTTRDALLMEQRHYGTRRPEPTCIRSICWVEGIRGRWSPVDVVGKGPGFNTRRARQMIREFRLWLRPFFGVKRKYLLGYFSWFARTPQAAKLTCQPLADTAAMTSTKRRRHFVSESYSFHRQVRRRRSHGRSPQQDPGLPAETTLASQFGATFATDAYFMAMVIPTLLLMGSAPPSPPR